MKLIVYLICVFLTLSVFYYLSRSDISRKNKIAIIILSVLLISVLVVYTLSKNARNEHYARVVSVFMRGEDILCDGVSVNNSSFNFISGTLSFIGKKDTDFFGMVIPIERCY